MTIKTPLLFLLFTFLYQVKTSNQTNDIFYYRKDIDMYFQIENGLKKTKILYKENWDFYFSLKNDSVAVIQDLKNKMLLPSKEYKVSSKVDTVYVKHGNGKTYDVEKKLYRTLN